jgi:pyrroline-5-carboxylate reductase
MDEPIAQVRSPGGTTAAALDSLEASGIRDIFARALTAARDRAVVLADNAHISGQD